MNIQKIVISIGIVLVGAVAAASLWSFTLGDTGLWSQHKLSRQIVSLEQEADSLQKELESRKREGERLLKDPFYIESIARTRYGMSRKGEVVYQFVGKDNP